MARPLPAALSSGDREAGEFVCVMQPSYGAHHLYPLGCYEPERFELLEEMEEILA